MVLHYRGYLDYLSDTIESKVLEKIAQEDGGIMMTGEFEGQTGEHPLGTAQSGLILPWTSTIDSKCWLRSSVVLHFLILKLTQL